MNEQPAPSSSVRKGKRSGTEKRRMQPRITFRVDEALRDKADMDAAAMSLTVGSYIRSLLADHCRIRPTRRLLPSEIALAQLRAEAGHQGGNLAQFLRLANRGEIPDSEDLAAAFKANRVFWERATEMLFGGF